MERYCRKCDSMVESNTVFCPDCKGLTNIKKVKSEPKHSFWERKIKKEPRYYDKYNPPSATMIYSRSIGMAREDVTYNRRHGIVPTGVQEAQKKLDKLYYSCSNCSAWLDGWCSNKKCNSSKNAICKDYEEQII